MMSLVLLGLVLWLLCLAFMYICYFLEVWLVTTIAKLLVGKTFLRAQL